MAANVPEEPQTYRNVSRFSETVMFDEPRQGAAVALEIVTHAIQPFNLRGADQRLSGLARFSGAKAHQALQGVVDFVCSGELEGRVRTYRFQHVVQRTSRHRGLGSHQETLVDQTSRCAERFVGPAG